MRHKNPLFGESVCIGSSADKNRTNLYVVEAVCSNKRCEVTSEARLSCHFVPDEINTALLIGSSCTRQRKR